MLAPTGKGSVASSSMNNLGLLTVLQVTVVLYSTVLTEHGDGRDGGLAYVLVEEQEESGALVSQHPVPSHIAGVEERGENLSHCTAQ